DVNLRSENEKTPVADILLTAGKITPEQRDDALTEQIRRRVHHVFTFPPETAFGFGERTPSSTEPPLKMDVLAPLWLGILDFPPEPQIERVLQHVGDHVLRMVSEAALERGDLDAPERALCEALTRTPMSLRELHERFVTAGVPVNRLVYFLVISKCAV